MRVLWRGVRIFSKETMSRTKAIQKSFKSCLVLHEKRTLSSLVQSRETGHSDASSRCDSAKVHAAAQHLEACVLAGAAPLSSFRYVRNRQPEPVQPIIVQPSWLAYNTCTRPELSHLTSGLWLAKEPGVAELCCL